MFWAGLRRPESSPAGHFRDSKMRCTFVVIVSFLAMCSGRPQDDHCLGSSCAHVHTMSPEHDSHGMRPTAAPGTGTTEDDDMSGEDSGRGQAIKGQSVKGQSEGHIVISKGLARQSEGEFLAPIPLPLPRPVPGPFPGPAPLRDRVAFSVRKASTYRAPTRVEFEDVLTNVGGGWSRSRAHFEAPYRGGYYFSFHAVAESRSEFTLALMKNGVYQVTAYATQGEYEHGSNSVFLELGRGQQVYLQLQEGSIYEHPRREAYTTFTGFMLYRY